MNNAGPTPITGDYQVPSTALTSKFSHISSVSSATNYVTPVKNENIAFSPSSLDDKTLDIISVDQLAQKLRDRYENMAISRTNRNRK